ncbi:MAG: methylmalonyl-CoA mutase family protein [bacterium]|jgi:methylmalonyl-CoA mutase
MESSVKCEVRSKLRVVTAASLFDGHDAAINVIRRLLQAAGAEVIHLGHNRSVQEIVESAIEEDAQAIAVSSYQGGHLEFFKYMYDMLRERGAGHIRIYGGGGGVIVPEEIDELHAYGIARIFSPEDGRRMGLRGMIDFIVKECAEAPVPRPEAVLAELSVTNVGAVAAIISHAEECGERGEGIGEELTAKLIEKAQGNEAAKGMIPVVGITGTGGSGKSSLTDELVLRFLGDFKDKNIAVITVDPSRRKTGGALLGDRIRMNAIFDGRVYMRSMATRGSQSELSRAIREAILVCKAAGFDLVIVETSGIGQGDSSIVDIADLTLYVMTSEYGAASQLEKIDMLDFADIVVINKFERRGGEDALRDVRKQVQRNKGAFDKKPEEMPVFPTIASQFNDKGVNALYARLVSELNAKGNLNWESVLAKVAPQGMPDRRAIIPPERVNYLTEIAQTVRGYKAWAKEQADIADALYGIWAALSILGDDVPCRLADYPADAPAPASDAISDLRAEWAKHTARLDPRCRKMLAETPELYRDYSGDEFVYKVRGKEIRVPLWSESLSHTKIPKVILPKYRSWGDMLQWMLLENVPGRFPFTAGVFPFKRTYEDPTRMFAGEGTPERTNKRFHFLSSAYEAKRLSTAFDSVTLYGEDPAKRPDIYGKIGNSGVSVCTLDDMKKLYAGFDLCNPLTSVSMTINGPAPMILAMFFNTAIDQQVDKFRAEKGRAPSDEEYAEIKAAVLSNVRGTVQADILKEDQGQNTCIFSTEFALKMMGDIQQYFIDNNIRNFYSVSISGYHIAEAGANPISQLAFTLANGFTYVEYYRARGMDVNAFGPNLSFFFSNGMEAEYAVIGRVARRIWAIALRDLYGADERAQMLKYHIQTSGRSLHAQEISFNDIRTTLQALLAIYDNAQSLHTNAYDEAITTPTEESVRRALAIQMIVNREFGLVKCENASQGSFIIEELTNLVEEAVLDLFNQISERGGVLGAMELQFQRGRIQEESLYYEELKHSGQYPIIGVNTFQDPATLAPDWRPDTPPLIRSTEEEKAEQLNNLRAFQARNADKSTAALARLREVALTGGNIFGELMETVKYCSLGEITNLLYEVGGKYRRNM